MARRPTYAAADSRGCPGASSAGPPARKAQELTPGTASDEVPVASPPTGCRPGPVEPRKRTSRETSPVNRCRGARRLLRGVDGRCESTCTYSGSTRAPRLRLDLPRVLPGTPFAVRPEQRPRESLQFEKLSVQARQVQQHRRPCLAFCRAGRRLEIERTFTSLPAGDSPVPGAAPSPTSSPADMRSLPPWFRSGLRSQRCSLPATRTPRHPPALVCGAPRG